jgi:hypothetical protein
MVTSSDGLRSIKDHFDETGQDLKRYRLPAVRERIIQQLPLLADWGQLPVNWADLMYLESEAIIIAMLELITHGIPSLSVHDSLIIPASCAELGKATLVEHYRHICGATPEITIKN